MKILLVGEYSSSHNTLKEGLQELGHEVLTIGDGDGFKKCYSDILLPTKFRDGFGKFLNKIIAKTLGLHLASISTKHQFDKVKHQLTGFDVVQLINEAPFNTLPKIEKQLLKFIFNNNKNTFLLSCGTDYVSVKYAHDKKFRYSILTPFFEGKCSKKTLWHALRYITPPYIDLHKFVYNNVKGVLASDMDYHIPLLNHEKYLGLMPNPINIEKLEYINLETSNKIVIFHGINRKNYYKKGNDIFEKALAIIKHKYNDTVEIITVENLPYNEYIKSFNKAHILLDQVYAYDQGFNALEAMAKGKVVFTGAEKEWLDFYNLKEDTVAINALPNAEYVAKKLEWLILNPDKISEISYNARAFIEKEHNYIEVAKKYLKKWQQ